MKKCKQILLAVCLTFAFVFLTACGSKEDVKNTTNASGTTSGMETTARESTDGMVSGTDSAVDRETDGARESTGVLEGVADDLKNGAETDVDRAREDMTEAGEHMESRTAL